ncbi:P-loop containing nucleoside triphosphate hydrolase protein, partial [Coemansia mojavensis]
MRIRPLSEDEYRRDRSSESAVRMLSENNRDENCTQQNVFEAVGKRAVDQCIQGYNGTIFAYATNRKRKDIHMQGARDEVKYLCRASYIEIYNETIYDLLDPLTRTCAMREDIKRGVFIDNVTEETVQDPNEAYECLFVVRRTGIRSHSVLMLVIQSLTQMDTGLTEIRESKFSLVDLAGSERQKLANTSGLRLKEAANINKSLSTLGNTAN